MPHLGVPQQRLPPYRFLTWPVDIVGPSAEWPIGMVPGSEGPHSQPIDLEQLLSTVPSKALSLMAMIARRKLEQDAAVLVIESMAHRCILEALKCCILHAMLVSAEEPSEMCLVSF